MRATMQRFRRPRAAAALLALAALAGCRDLLVEPARGPARVAVSVSPRALQVARDGATDAFDQADSVRVALAVFPDTVGEVGQDPAGPRFQEEPGLIFMDVTLPFTPADSVAVAVELPDSVEVEEGTSLLAIVILMRGRDPLFLGNAAAPLVRDALTTTEVSSLTAMPAEVRVAAPSRELTHAGDGVRLQVAGFFATGHEVPGDELFVTATSLDPEVAVASVAFDGDGMEVEVVAVGGGEARIEVRAVVALEPVTDTVVVRVSSLPSAQSFAAVSAGGAHTCALEPGGKAWCWGSGADGRLGRAGSTEGSNVPVEVALGLVYDAVSAGHDHSCAVDRAERLLCWGRNDVGQLGIGSTAPSATGPVLVPGGKRWTRVAAGYRGTCAITTSAEAHCWGGNAGGRLGAGANAGDQRAPVPVQGGHAFTEVGMGAEHACALQAGTGHAYCWGSNAGGMLGVDALPASEAPVAVAGGIAFQALSVGAYHTCAVTASDALYCWGQNGHSQLGQGDTGERVGPVKVGNGLGFTSVSAGWIDTCAVATSGTAFCWGGNSKGMGGHGAVGETSVPTAVSIPGSSVRQVTAGFEHACFLSHAGPTYCAGAGELGQIGDGFALDRHLPAAVRAGSVVVEDPAPGGARSPNASGRSR